MSAIGFNEPLYILPFDQRGRFQTKMFGWTGRTNGRDRLGKTSRVAQMIEPERPEL
jgi:hypothetical protein